MSFFSLSFREEKYRHTSEEITPFRFNFSAVIGFPIHFYVPFECKIEEFPPSSFFDDNDDLSNVAKPVPFPPPPLSYLPRLIIR